MRKRVRVPPRPVSAPHRLAREIGRACLRWAAVAMLALCPARLGAQYYGIDIPAAPVVFLVDVSGSMEQRDEGGRAAAGVRSRIIQGVEGEVGRRLGGRAGQIAGNRLRREASELGAATRELSLTALRSMPSGSTFNIITFGGSVTEWREGFVPAHTTNSILAATHLQRLSASGGTPMLQALRRAFAYREVATIFLLSDGAPTDASAAQVLQAVERMNEGRYVTINTIGVGPDQNADLLCRLAERNGGVYVTGRTARCRAPTPPSYPRLVERSPGLFSRRTAATLDAANTMEIRTRDPYLAVELRTLAVGPDGLRFRMQALPLDERGNVVPVMTTGSKEFGGHFVGSTIVTLHAGDNPHGTLWRLHVPAQSPVNGTSDGVDVYLRYNPVR
jgi:uncharacterized protein YegL